MNMYKCNNRVIITVMNQANIQMEKVDVLKYSK